MKQKSLPSIAFLMLICLAAPALWAQETIKVGVLYALTGPLAASQLPLKDAALMAIEDTNARGGLLGRKVEALVFDVGVDPSQVTDVARRLLDRDKVSLISGCLISSCVDAVRAVLRERRTVFISPARYDRYLVDPGVFFTGATPDQLANAAANFRAKNLPNIKRVVLVGSDFPYAHSVNRILRPLLKSQGVEVAFEQYQPLSQFDVRDLAAKIKDVASRDRIAVISTFAGGFNVRLYRAFADGGVQMRDTPTLALLTDDLNLQSPDFQPVAVGSFAAQSYFESVSSPTNDAFVRRWQTFSKDLPANGAVEGVYIGINLWAQAVKKAGSTDFEKVAEALKQQTYNAFSGYQVTLDPATHRLAKPVLVGEITAQGKTKVVWKPDAVFRPQVALDVCNIKSHCEADPSCPRPCPTD